MRLTKAEYGALADAVAHLEAELEDTYPRRIPTLNRAWRKVQESTDETEGMVHLAKLPFAGYELTAIGSTADKARELVEGKAFESIKRAEDSGQPDPFDPRPDGTEESLFEYMGGSVTVFTIDEKVDWM